MSKKTFRAEVLPAAEKLVGEGESKQVIRTRQIRVLDAAGETVKTLESADDDADTQEKLAKAGYVVGDRSGDSYHLTQRPMNGGERFAVGCFVLILLAIAGLFVGCQALINSGDDRDFDQVDESDARRACEDFVEQQLKSPSTAEYSNQSESGGGSSWTASGTVDSQNGFGAMVRTRYSCTLSYSPMDASWTGRATLAE